MECFKWIWVDSWPFFLNWVSKWSSQSCPCWFFTYSFYFIKSWWTNLYFSWTILFYFIKVMMLMWSVYLLITILSLKRWVNSSSTVNVLKPNCLVLFCYFICIFIILEFYCYDRATIEIILLFLFCIRFWRYWCRYSWYLMQLLLW